MQIKILVSFFLSFFLHTRHHQEIEDDEFRNRWAFVFFSRDTYLFTVMVSGKKENGREEEIDFSTMVFAGRPTFVDNSWFVQRFYMIGLLLRERKSKKKKANNKETRRAKSK